MIEIPLTQAPSQRFTIILEGDTVTFLIQWESLRQGWVMSLEREQVTILSGQRLVMGTDLLRAYNLGIGGLVMSAVEQPGVPPGRNDFGERVTMLHFTESEIASSILS